MLSETVRETSYTLLGTLGHLVIPVEEENPLMHIVMILAVMPVKKTTF